MSTNTNIHSVFDHFDGVTGASEYAHRLSQQSEPQRTHAQQGERKREREI
jgi:hypothetical protein